MDTAQLKVEMEAKVAFRKRWLEEEYDPDQHGDPYEIIAMDLLEVAAAHIVKKAVEGFLKTRSVEFGGGGILDRRKQEIFSEKIPRTFTSINRFM